MSTPPASPSTEPQDWRKEAACRFADPTIFFDDFDRDANAQSRRIREAKSFCFQCLVRLECLVASFRESGGYGIWGGFTEKERKELQKKYGTPRGA